MIGSGKRAGAQRLAGFFRSYMYWFSAPFLSCQDWSRHVLGNRTLPSCLGVWDAPVLSQVSLVTGLLSGVVGPDPAIAKP
jgi:hypothetical protein